MLLTKKGEARLQRLLPDGVPRYIRVYDNGGRDKEGGSIDRYTVVFSGHYAGRKGCDYVGMSAIPFHPQGVGQHGWNEVAIDRPKYKHLGKKIKFKDLPHDCKVLVMYDYIKMWDLSPELIVAYRAEVRGPLG